MSRTARKGRKRNLVSSKGTVYWGNNPERKYSRPGGVREWEDLNPEAQERFLATFLTNPLRFWPKTEKQWVTKRGVRFLEDGTGYILTLAELPNEYKPKIVPFPVVGFSRDLQKKVAGEAHRFVPIT